jgi:hypothetical protein
MAMQCGGCGATIGSNDVNCPTCGATQQAVKMRYVIAVVLVIVAILAVAVTRR